MNPLDDLTDDDCRWVHGDPGAGGDWHYCRKPRARYADGTYRQGCWCDDHRKITMRTGQEYFKAKSAA